jgi:hypothetical protein
MQLKEIREAFENGTGSANTLNRQLIFSGIAIVWILKGGTDVSITGIPPQLLKALILLAASFTLDMCQSLLHVLIWYCRYASFKKEELAKSGNENGLDEEKIIVNEKEWWSIPTWLFWASKICLSIWAYVLIILRLIGQLS